MPKYGQGSTHQNQFIDASIFYSVSQFAQLTLDLIMTNTNTKLSTYQPNNLQPTNLKPKTCNLTTYNPTTYNLTTHDVRTYNLTSPTMCISSSHIPLLTHVNVAYLSQSGPFGKLLCDGSICSIYLELPLAGFKAQLM